MTYSSIRSDITWVSFLLTWTLIEIITLAIVFWLCFWQMCGVGQCVGAVSHLQSCYGNRLAERADAKNRVAQSGTQSHCKQNMKLNIFSLLSSSSCEHLLGFFIPLLLSSLSEPLRHRWLTSSLISALCFYLFHSSEPLLAQNTNSKGNETR